MITIAETGEIITADLVDTIETEKHPKFEDYSIITLTDLRRCGFSGDRALLDRELESPTAEKFHVELIHEP